VTAGHAPCESSGAQQRLTSPSAKKALWSWASGPGGFISKLTPQGWLLLFILLAAKAKGAL
jgi:hypothetical protein